MTRLDIDALCETTTAVASAVLVVSGALIMLAVAIAALVLATRFAMGSI